MLSRLSCASARPPDVPRNGDLAGRAVWNGRPGQALAPAQMKLVPIQVLRAAAALAVAMLHAQYEAGLLAATSGRPFRPFDLLPWEAGVDVFFVISGFVMVFASRRMFGRGWGGPEPVMRVFLARRIARVVPLYWLATTLYLGLALASPGIVNVAPSPGFVVASYAFWPAARPDGLVQPLYSLGWTLNFEMFFYLLFALALPWPRRTAVLVVTMAQAVLVAVVAARGAPLPLSFWGDPIVLEFVLGMALGLARTEGLLLGPSARLALGALGLVLFALVEAGFGSALPRALVFGLPAGCLVAACGLGREHALAEETRLTRIAAIVGDASYALYLTHPFVVRGLRRLIELANLDIAVGPWPFVALALVAALAASIGVHLLIERPVTATTRRLLEPRSSRAEPRGSPAR
jgi:exopolysaccharide production protein ExoZ